MFIVIYLFDILGNTEYLINRLKDGKNKNYLKNSDMSTKCDSLSLNRVSVSIEYRLAGAYYVGHTLPSAVGCVSVVCAFFKKISL